MRRDLAQALGAPVKTACAHAGLLYERYVPLIYGDEPRAGGEKQPPAKGGIRSPADRERLIRDVASIAIPAAYSVAWRRWRAALNATDTATRMVEATGRVLIGHGNPAPTEVGITLHPVYGVPIIPGSALKGVLNYYLATWGFATESGWEGVQYDAKGRPIKAPGAFHQVIFGAADLPDSVGGVQEGSQGGVMFEDAWLVPTEDRCSLCADVLTPHQHDYYRATVKHDAFPNDWTDPTPVTFLTIKPKMRFLLAVSGGSAGRAGAELALAHLLDALEQWGLGAKTRAGYGRFIPVADNAKGSAEDTEPPPRTPAAAPSSPALLALNEAVSQVLKPADPNQAPPIAERLDALVTDELLAVIDPAEYPAARGLIDQLAKHAGLRKRRGARIEQLFGKVTR